MRNFTRTKTEEEFENKILEIKRVVRVTSGGKRFRFKVIVVIGDGKGTVGLGIGKADDISKAIDKAKRQAKKNLLTFNLVDQRTIPFEVEKTYKSSKVLLKPSAKGNGIVAGGTVRIVCRLAGIQDITSKAYGSANKLNRARAVLLALKEFAK